MPGRALLQTPSSPQDGFLGSHFEPSLHGFKPLGSGFALHAQNLLETWFLNIYKSKHLYTFFYSLSFHYTKTEKTFMPSPSASSKFGLSILNFFGHAQFFMYTQNHFGILKS